MGSDETENSNKRKALLRRLPPFLFYQRMIHRPLNLVKLIVLVVALATIVTNKYHRHAEDNSDEKSAGNKHSKSNVITNEIVDSSIGKNNVSNKCQWKSEPLWGICDVTKATAESKAYKTALECENGCCENKDCVTFQFRTKEGCQWGGDTRLGAEKDGVSAWCEPRPPAAWHGQRITEGGVLVAGSCDDDGWNPQELNGQCFNLGTKKETTSNTPESCRNACCSANKGIDVVEDMKCRTWQWRADSGCFYTKKEVKRCRSASDPLDLEKFTGKRKVMPNRKYLPYAYSADFADMAAGS